MEDTIPPRLKPYVVNSNDALEFKLIRKCDDIEDCQTTFKPEFSHQIFGDSELIFGYKDLHIKLYYTAGALETYLGLEYSDKISKSMVDGVQPHDILPMMREKLSSHVHENIDDFIKSLSKEDDFKPVGSLLHSFSIDDGTRNFEVYKGDIRSAKFLEHHLRLRTFLLWYIDAASYVDIDDEQWEYFTLFEKYTSENGTIRYGTVGYGTVYQYYAYPANTRPRIAQFFILPPFQKKGLGTELLKAIYMDYIGKKDVKDITVEDPSADFQKLRDYVDCLNCSTLPSFSKNNLKQNFTKEMASEAREKFKINKKQARRVYEILRLQATNLSDPYDYREYRLNVKRRLNIPYKKEQNDMKKIEAALKSKEQESVTLPLQEKRLQILESDYTQLEEEYKKVVERLNSVSSM